MCVENKVRETIGDVFVQHVELNNVLTFPPMKRLVSKTVGSAKPVATF